jgi:DNA polymerase
MRTISLDFETRSPVALPDTGVYPYATHPDTDIWCMAWAVDDEEPSLWVPGDPVPTIFHEEVELRAWNAAFERRVYTDILVPRYGFPAKPLGAFVCTMAEAAAMALPRALGKAARVLKVTDQKDDSGHRLMKQMARPRRPRKTEDPDALLWWDDENRKQKLYAYCLQDVRTERAVAAKVRALTETERKLYVLDQKANDRGVKLDIPLIEAAIEIRDEAVRRSSEKLAELTDGACTSITNTADIRKWLGEESISKEAIQRLLEEETDPTRRAVLELRQQAGKSSVAKLDTMLRVRHEDDRAHGLLQFLGADTGRWAGRLIQPQNFPRPSLEDPEALIPLVMGRDYAALEQIAHPMECLSDLLRSMLIAEAPARFLCADFASIEGWVVAWLAGQDGMTSYEEMAAAIFGKRPDEIEKGSGERMIGKAAVLGCGYGMGRKKFRDTVYDQTGVLISEALADRAVTTYRAVNNPIQSLWYELENAARAAVATPGRKVYAGREGAVRYHVQGPYLWAKLPSGRFLCYPLPQLVDTLTPWGEVKKAVEISTTNSYTRKWERRTLYGGLQTENVVQAIARDVMAEAMLNVEQAGYPVILTVHDEILAEAETGTLDEFCEIMGATPEWAPDLRVSVEGWEGERYRK